MNLEQKLKKDYEGRVEVILQKNILNIVRDLILVYDMLYKIITLIFSF